MKSEVVYCWNCKTAMDIEGNYYKCSRCGATWNEIPTLGTFIDIEVHKDGKDGTKAYRPVKRRPRAKSKARG